MPKTVMYVGLDVGGTTMKAAAVDDAGRPRPSAVLPTEPEKGPGHFIDTMCETVRRAAAAADLPLDRVAAVGVATPGLMDIKLGMILEPPNLKPLHHVEVPRAVAAKLGKKVAFQNDGNAAALGEFWVGAGRDAESMVLFTLGTGVGGGIILGGQVLEGQHSHGGELGHVRVALPEQGRRCGCGRRGCLEAYASATAVVDRTRDAIAAYRGPTRLRELLRDDDGDSMTAKEVFDTAAAGDALAEQLVDETAYYLGLGACQAIATVDPELIVFGGGMVAAGEPFLAKIREYVLRFGLGYPARQVAVKFAELGSDAGFIGAAACARKLVQAGG